MDFNGSLKFSFIRLFQWAMKFNHISGEIQLTTFQPDFGIEIRSKIGQNSNFYET